MILDNICDKRKEQLERDISIISRQDIKYMAAEKEYQTVSFSKSIKRDTLSVISEVKKASPSKGLICPDFDPVKIACEYEKNGANAISCLTEEHYFQGSGEYLKAIRAAVKLPILRKDFIIDEYQLYEARAIGADAVLLISAILSEDQMKEYSDIAHELDLECLVEVHNEDARRLGLKDGDWVAMSSPYGEIRMRVKVTALAKPGVLLAIHGYTEANVNELVGQNHVDPYTGFPGFKGLRCNIRKVEGK